ncbi:regulatory particle non-ATPase 7 isoform X2 [Dermatophagoides farinae]|uniref:26S proteasome non-ATPase regulatory subunit 6 n=1 Tax=Dermatophagoides farinae TaxID=6954 RepID=A0A922ICH8_DERFA|nr:26S proteasome non-ATPase regulatory subunit 6-like [Dermatophagoides farinae]KAH7642299.1 26s proteasome non-atpase regulatory subunit 6-like [Dermatophagoides farinae]KAH9529507.1 26S proteasome non-ATPase regulatory subunit 6 [Dermatophagoides farinae]
MPAENLEDESLAKNPNLELSQWLFLLTIEDNASIRQNLMDAITQNDMAPFYKMVCETLKWPINEELYEKMKKKNDEKIKEFDFAIEDAEKNLGEMEVREANLAKAEYYSMIGDKENTMSAFRKTYDKTVSLGHRLDLLFHIIRIGLFYLDHKLISINIEKAKELIEEGGDWDRRNRLRVYQGFYCITIRDFQQAASLFLDTISTFTCYELCDYKTFVAYTVITAMISLPRVQLRKNVIKGAEILEVLHGNPELREFLFSLYECNYSKFFEKLCWIEYFMKKDRLFQPHYRFYIREMRILAYNQLLESYRSLELKYMADAFGVTVNFIDQELARFIAAGRLFCKIDKVNGIVETNRPDAKNHQYQACIKHGDILLNRIQKLSRVINI